MTAYLNGISRKLQVSIMTGKWQGKQEGGESEGQPAQPTEECYLMEQVSPKTISHNGATVLFDTSNGMSPNLSHGGQTLKKSSYTNLGICLSRQSICAVENLRLWGPRAHCHALEFQFNGLCDSELMDAFMPHSLVSFQFFPTTSTCSHNLTQKDYILIYTHIY